MSRPTVRLLHTSDVHIGDGQLSLRLSGLRGVIEIAQAEAVDALMIVGDLFDSSRVADDQIDAALAEISRLDIPTVVTCGNHDALESPSIHERMSLADAGSHVRFAAERDGGYVVLPEASLAIWARGMVEHCPQNEPLAGYSPYPGDYWQVVMAHAHHVDEPDAESHRSSRISPFDIAALDCDYVALGHWHRFFDASAGKVAAYYSGAPSEAGGSFASANLITLEPGRAARVERVPVPLSGE
jgi:DNA repair exonuclease SbcCD nuclease subunit